MSILKKGGYFGAVIAVTAVALMLYFAFFNIPSPTSAHESLSLAPHTAEEQQDLIEAQEEQATAHEIVSGPLVARMDVPQAQQRVLYPNQNTPAQ
ncbi:MAG: hypothetical protein ACD_70C00031G0001 [uncultured bacterium]|nr:MAG: hypothetical protein ACD_70C00031G0001 [uncultured bacterium]OGT26563.1 MAG: hypothetical protein A3B71_02765 [Gammaproteobacteria bacterium RIFCSPHIGHO2_02_FULL_42_43]OGT28031.1 MAG: hypothetical protein A2624_07020 [Gammaproteobacteria bacterium RIFCSPHIGHO2_01_FULL_42_8]OGT51990.1 MAG: hypothetical protein A3E54_04270 [Gammaproteobacteria bacterium RIFCSPHIGHO2_12_FULL_41_25]OGT61095.1 MAG: hypothetical protein A3I77_06930 [Gammaproteobacteria bacterium RIFCSPLOWO2_02_FULL_42_14]OGT